MWTGAACAVTRTAVAESRVNPVITRALKMRSRGRWPARRSAFPQPFWHRTTTGSEPSPCQTSPSPVATSAIDVVLVHTIT